MMYECANSQNSNFLYINYITNTYSVSIPNQLDYKSAVLKKYI